jgi:hypothetical protein
MTAQRRARRALAFAITMIVGSFAHADRPDGLQTNRAVMAEVLGASACFEAWARRVAEGELAIQAKAQGAKAEERRKALRAALYKLDEVALEDKARLSRLPGLEPLSCNDPGVATLIECKKAEGHKQTAPGKRSQPKCTDPKVRLELPLVFDARGLLAGRP